QFGKISNHANDYVYSNPSYTLTPVSTAITYTVKDSTDAIVTTETVSIIANSQPLTPEYYTFTWTPTDSGMHSIIVTGFSGADMCTNLENTPDQISMGLNVDPIPTYSVNFQISADSSPLENVLIEMDSKSGTTDTDGNVTLSGFTSGTYTYTASKTGYNTVTGDVEIVDINKELAFSMYITNTAPIVSGLPDKTLVQDSSDSSIDLDNYVTDSTDADSTLTWTYTGNSNIGVSIDPTTHILTLTAPQSWTGSEDITFTATDPKGLSDSDTLKVTVTASNTAPTLNPLPDQNLDEDNHIFDAFNLNDYASDTETPDSGLTYTITGNTNPSVGVSIDSSDMIDIQPSTNWYGYSDITIQVNDGEFTDTDTFRITVTSVNDAPEITGVPTTISIKVNTIYTIDLTQFEYDEEDSNAELIWTITGIDTSLYTATIDSEDLLTITPQTDMVGSDIATLTLTDSGGLTDTQEITINISEEPNTAPSISGLPDRSLDEDSHIDNAIYLKNHASDAETPDSNLTYAITGISNTNAGVSIDIYNNIDIYPITNWYGTSIVTVQVTDEGGLTDTDSFIITVTPEKDAPIISVPLPDLTLIEGASDSSIDLDNHFSDPDGDILYYSSTEPNHATVYIDPYTNIVTIIAGTGWTGTEDITFTADDGFLTASDTLTLTITAAFVNHAPIAYPITTETDEDTEKAITLNATDEDNDPLTYSIVSNPAHGTVSITGDTATYTPDADYNGPDAFYYWAYDSTEYSNTAIVSITVNPINDAPTISCLPDQSLDEDSHIDNAIYLKDHACDAETPDSNLTYTITGNTNPNVGVSIDIYNNIDIYPITNWYGTSTVTIQVTDEDGLTDTDTFVITVTPEKDAPIISEPLPDLTLDEGASDSSIDLDNHFSDPDGDALSYTSTAPAHATVAIDPITHIVTITAGTGWAGTEDITFTADDGFLTVSDTMTLTITTTSANHAPIAHDINTETDEDTEKAITLNATDEDGDPLTYSIVSTHGTISITGDTATYTPDADYNGPDSFTYKAYDGTEYSNTATVFITVNPINDAPVISTPLPDLTVMEGTSDSSIDLDNHFSDPDNDILSYTSTALDHATVYINPYTHVITVTALP
ncbi:MAG: tandem-95 repeat protein, partial [Gammaproteobacteria bacterium]|nr:tandem-95 repeat protein [Gammaproteobacteria bacterium]